MTPRPFEAEVVSYMVQGYDALSQGQAWLPNGINIISNKIVCWTLDLILIVPHF